MRAYQRLIAATRGDDIVTYEDRRLVDVVLAKTVALRDVLLAGGPVLTATELPLFAAIALVELSEIRVVDFGGAAGAQYFRARAVFGDRVARWQVVETAAMVEAARDLEDGCLSFSTSLPGVADLVYSSGALQYAPDPAQALADLLAIDAPVICLTRLHFGVGERELQRSRLSDNGPGAMPPNTSDAWVSYWRTSLVRTDVEASISAQATIVGDMPDGFIATRATDRRQ